MEPEIEIVYVRTVYSPSELAGKKGDRRAIAEHLGRRLIAEGYAVSSEAEDPDLKT